MVIQQFNKLIRNKWLWGVFAIIVGGAFAFDFLIADLTRDTGSGREEGEGAGRLAGETVKLADFSTIAEDIRGLGRDRDWQRKSWEINELAWETIGTLKVAERDGIVATDGEVAAMIRNDQSFADNGQFSFQRYNAILRSNGIAPERYEAFLKRRATANRVAGLLADSATWVSPAEIDRAVADMTDRFTVRVARFSQAKEDAEKVVLDEKGLRKWYDENTNSIALPKRMRLRMVAFDATKDAVQKKMSVTEEEMRDHYDATVEKYTSTGTNGVEVVKKFEEVKADVEKELRQIAALNFFETNLNQRVYAVKPAKGVSRLDEIAKEEGANVTTSAWFSVDGAFVSGFMRPATTICPEAEGFKETVAELDPSSEDLRYGVIASKRKVWLVEVLETSPAHVPTFAEAADVIRPRALAAAKEDAFKKEIEALAAKGTNAVLTAKGANVTTNTTFVISELSRGDFPDQRAIAGATRKLVSGGISEFTRLTPSTALLVVCTDRQPGDVAKAAMLRTQVASELATLARRQLPEAWQKWNLKRLGCEPGSMASTEKVAEEEE